MNYGLAYRIDAARIIRTDLYFPNFQEDIDSFGIPDRSLQSTDTRSPCDIACLLRLDIKVDL